MNNSAGHPDEVRLLRVNERARDVHHVRFLRFSDIGEDVLRASTFHEAELPFRDRLDTERRFAMTRDGEETVRARKQRISTRILQELSPALFNVNCLHYY